MAALAPGTYSIINARFHNVAVLPDDNRDSDIVGRPEENSLRGTWDVSRLGNGKYTIKNQAIPHSASSDHGAEVGDFVYGGESVKELIIKERNFKGKYTISPADAANLFWGLLEGEANTPITLANVPTDTKNQWRFIPTGGIPQHLPNSGHARPQGQVVTAGETPQASLFPNASQSGYIGTDSSAPRPPLSASDAHVYIRNLIKQGHGCPLYIPESSGNSPLYQTKGVRIGDVGFVTEDGDFEMLFNIRASVYDPINVCGVPDGFEKIDLGKNDIKILPHYFKSGRIVASVTTTSEVLGPDPPAAGLSVVSNGHRLIWNTSEGAVLHLPRGATRLRCDSKLFRDQAIRNGYNWYKYAWHTRHCCVRNGALCLVTGTDKTNTWMVGAFSQTPPGNQVLLNIRTDVATHENFPYSYSWIGTNPAARDSMCTPIVCDTAIDRADREQDDEVFRFDAPDGLTHSVFVRGFRISLQQGLLASLSRRPLPAELSLIQDSAPEDFAGGQGRKNRHGVFSSLFSIFQGGGNPVREGQPRASNSENSPLQLGRANEEAMVEYVPMALPVDPAATVNDLLLNLVPEADVAVIHDDEWHSLMQEDDADFPDSLKLVARLQRKYTLDVRTGSVSLRPAEPPFSPFTVDRLISHFHLKPYLCPTCRMGFSTSRALELHRKMCFSSRFGVPRQEVSISEDDDDVIASRSADGDVSAFTLGRLGNTINVTSERMAHLGGENLRCEISDVDVVNVVNQMLSKDEGKVSAFTVDLLVELLKHDDACRWIFQSDIFETLANKLKYCLKCAPQGTIDLMLQIGHLGNRTGGGMEYGIVQIIFAAFAGFDHGVSRSMIDCLARSASDEDLRRIMLGSDVLPVLVHMLESADSDTYKSAVNALVKLAKHDDPRRIILDLNAVAMLITKLQDGASDVRNCAAKALAELAVHDDSRRIILNAVAVIITKLQDGDSDVRNCAAKALAELGKHGDLRSTMFDSNALAILMTKLQHSDSYIWAPVVTTLVELGKSNDCINAERRKKIISDDSHRTMLDLNAVAMLVTMLRDSKAYVRNSAAEALIELAKHDDSRCAMLDSNAIAILMTELRDVDSYARDLAGQALIELAKHDDSLRIMLNSNAVAMFITMLQDSLAYIRNLAAQGVVELAKHDILRRTMLDSNAVAILITKLQDSHSNVQNCAVQSLMELAKHDDLRCTIFDPNTIAILMTKLQDSDFHVRDSAAQALQLAMDDDSHHTLDSNPVAILIAKLQDSFSDVRRLAAQALVELGKHEGSRRIMLDLNAVVILIAKLQDDGWSVRQSAAQALAELAKHDDSRRTMLDLNAVAFLIAKLQDSGWFVRQPATQALTELARHGDSRRTLLDSNAVAIIITKLQDSDFHARYSAAQALAELTKHDDSRCTMLNLNAVTILITRLQDCDSEVRNSATRALLELAEHSEQSTHTNAHVALGGPRRTVLDLNAVAILIAQMQGRDLDVRNSASRALAELAEHDGSCRTMLDLNVVMIFIATLRDNDRSVRECAAQALVELAKHDGSRRAMLDLNAVAMLITELQGGSWVVPILVELAKHDDSRSTLLDLNAVAILITELRRGDLCSPGFIAPVLVELGKHDDSCRTLLDLNTVATLFTLLPLDVGNSVAQALVELGKHDGSCLDVLYTNVLATLLHAMRRSQLHGHEALTHLLVGLIMHNDSRQRMSLSRLIVILITALSSRADRLKETFDSVIESTKRSMFLDVS